MQYHFVIFYDDEMNKWGMEYDDTAYFPDGNVFDHNNMEWGWFYPEDGSPAEIINGASYSIIQHIVDTFPVPVVE